MKAINSFMNDVPAEIKIRQQEYIAKVLTDKYILAFIQENNLNEIEVNDNMSKFVQFYQQSKNENMYFGYKPVLNAVRTTFGLNIEVIQQKVIPKTDEDKRKLNNIKNRVVYDAKTQQFDGVSLSDYEITEFNSMSVKRVKEFIEKYKMDEKQKGLWIYGKFGRGKTYLMAALATEMYRKGANIHFVSINQLINNFSRLMNYRDNSLSTAIQSKKDCEILILDDMGTESVKDYQLSNFIYEILDYRAVNNKPTFFTSNYKIREYMQKLNQKVDDEMISYRLVERIEMLCDEINMLGENRRDK